METSLSQSRRESSRPKLGWNDNVIREARAKARPTPANQWKETAQAFYETTLRRRSQSLGHDAKRRFDSSNKTTHTHTHTHTTHTHTHTHTLSLSLSLSLSLPTSTNFSIQR
jgi:hypothetical protein